VQQQEQINIRNLIAACSAICVFGLAFGMTYPLLSLILESRGVSTGMIGINSAMMPIGILLFSTAIPFLAGKYGSRRLAICAAVITSCLILSYKVFDSLEAWFVLRLLQGMSISTLFVLSEAWIVRFAGSQHRGKIIALYGSILSASFGTGPALVGWIGIEGWAPFILGSLVILLGVFPLFLLREESIKANEESNAAGIFEFAPKAPMLLACVFAFAIFDAATLSLLPVYGRQNGMDIPAAALFLTALIIGNTVLQFPIGWLADRFPHRLVLGGCALITVLMLAILPSVISTQWMWPVVVLAGACGYGIYTVSLTALGSRFQGAQLINGSAAFAVMWGVGALIGSLSGGWSMSTFGPNGLPYHLSVVYFVLVIGLGVRGYRLFRSKSVERTEV
jgi:MFS family permease